MRTPIKSKVKKAHVPLDEKWYWVAWFTWELFNRHTSFTHTSLEYADALRTGNPPPFPTSRYTVFTLPAALDVLPNVMSRCVWQLHEDGAIHESEQALVQVAVWLDAYMLRNLPLRRKLIKEYFGDW